MTVADRRAENDFRSHGEDDRENHGPQMFVWVQQHAGGETGNEARRKKIQEAAEAASEAKFTVLDPRIDPIKKHRDANSRENSREWCGPGLLEAKHCVAEHVPDNH